ncbi:Qat anti-phage system QueC-like protein QatC [Actinoplanes rectilineatus]|uniref:Qat anti-phage system QueC-like protein QatC n=1 Tax=Actinoplanes rectilineatus TaxID=113571 RepID=UPI000AE05CAB|nr:Qat anti-phage system QueC-like protein QatC [Actinoplanes rectilineatus]
MATGTVRLRIRSALTGSVPADVDRLLDWAPGRREATIEFTTGFFDGWTPTAAGTELLRFAAGIYCGDRTVEREPQPDGWTRTLRVDVPVADPEAWDQAGWAGTLGFLTGDRWNIRPRRARPAAAAPTGLDIDAVSLFSGGLDSLCGVIDLLEEDPNRRLLLVGHYEAGQASTAQRALYAGLAKIYGNRVVLRRLFCRPAPADEAQALPLPDQRERTTRSRSLLFIAAALAAASAAGPHVPVYVPENGWIGLNVPLTRARTGSASTRTTHPHFMTQLTESCRGIGITNPIVNPYRLQTKGEMLAGCRNPRLLIKLAPASVSCSHPETPRWRGREQGNCGYCLPCLVRRASLAHTRRDRGDQYAWDALSDEGLLDPDQRTGADLRALVRGVNPHRDELAIVRNAPLPAGEHQDHLQLWHRGAAEVRTWLGGAGGRLAELTENAWRSR